jgi:hypothetical protein|tara:strand:- start:43 stop:324 length:282 start_codon:yes stop_codon:yes gene_type:complete
MEPLSRLEDMKEAAARLSIEIVTGNLFDQEISIQSGYCKFKGKDMIIIDEQLTPEEQVEVILNTLKQFDLETIYLPSWIRENIESGRSVRTQS